MKKAYVTPAVVVCDIVIENLLVASAETKKLPVYDDETLDGGQALTRRRRRSVWDDDEQDEAEGF